MAVQLTQLVGNMIQKEPFWDDLLNDIKSQAYQTVYVVGNTDCGKTFLCRYLAQQMLSEKKVALIDCDPGQSNLGLPTTLNAGIFTQPEMENPEQIFSRFIGVTTPSQKKLHCLLAVQRLKEKMQQMGSEFTIFDSSGYSSGTDAVEFQAILIEAIQPDLVIMVEHENELDLLARHITKLNGVEIRRLPVSQHVTPRSMPIRREYREKKFRQYFQNSDLKVVDISNMLLCGSLPERFTVQTVRGRLIAFLDSEKFVIRVAVARSIYDNDQICVCLVPDFNARDAAFLQIGDLFLDPELKEDHSRQAS